MNYLHIGLPKNLSTTLQRDYFSKHPDLFHLGVGIESNVDYVHPCISAICENHLQYSHPLSFEKSKHKLKEELDKLVNTKFTYLNKKVGISLELLSFTFTPDHISVVEKAKRAKYFFGDETKVIIILRNQKDLIESLWRESVKIGGDLNFGDYLNYLYLKRDNNFIYDFDYSFLLNVYSKFFGRENIYPIFIENYRSANGELIEGKSTVSLVEKLNEILCIQNVNLQLDHYNSPIPSKDLLEVIRLNSINRNGISNSLYGMGANFHRLKDHFSYELGLSLEDKYLYKDARQKNQNIKEARSHNGGSFSYHYPEHIREWLNITYSLSNRKLSDEFGLVLPCEYEDPFI